VYELEIIEDKLQMSILQLETIQPRTSNLEL
jgi:hypothetical protein